MKSPILWNNPFLRGLCTAFTSLCGALCQFQDVECGLQMWSVNVVCKCGLQTWQVAAGRFGAFLRILFPWKARIQENSEGSQSHFGRFPAFFRNLFPFSRFFASFFCMKREQNSDNRRKTPRTLLQEAKIQVRIGFKGEQILKKSRKTPGSFQDFDLQAFQRQHRWTGLGNQTGGKRLWSGLETVEGESIIRLN